MVALAVGCDSGSSAMFEDMPVAGAGAAGVAGSSSAGTTSTSGGSSSAGTTSGSGGTTGGGGTQSTLGGMNSAGAGGTAGGLSVSGSGGSAGSTNGGGGGGGQGGADDVGLAGAGQAGAGASGGEGGAMGGGDAGDTGAPGEGGSGGDHGCGAGLGWHPRASKVMFLVDRSGTMFEPQSIAWSAVRDAALPVIDSYDASLDIGFMAMTGEAASCPLLDEIAPKPDNYAAIASLYTSLAKPTKGESPFMLALSRARELLDGAPEGEPTVILVVDGHPDFCNDGNDLCPIDSVVARLQLLQAAGIRTLVAGLPIYAGANTALYSAALQSYANAGAGLPVASVGDTATNIYYQCSGGSATPPSWTAEFTASGKPAMQALGTYSASPGTAPVTLLNPADAADLTAALTALFASTRSCSFETSGGKVTLADAASGVVELDNVTVPYDATNGWQLRSETVIELVGSACGALRASASAQVTFDFPCSAEN